MSFSNYREKMFAGMPWYQALQRPPNDHRPSAYWMLKARYDRRHRWLEEALRWLEQNRLWEEYRVRFAGLKFGDFAPDHVKLNKKRVSTPVAEIAFEPLAALVLERFLKWTYVSREVSARGTFRCDWAFQTPDDQDVHVEVKTITDEPERDYMVGSGAGEVKSAFDQAQKKLKKGMANLIVIGDHTHINLFDVAAHMDGVARNFLGYWGIRLHLMKDASVASEPFGPSFHNMMVQPVKNTRLSGVLCIRPEHCSFHGILCRMHHNPWAKNRIDPKFFKGIQQGYPLPDNSGLAWSGNPCVTWRRIR